MKPKITVFMAMSLDGFIADQSGRIDWLNSISSEIEEGEDLGFSELLSKVDLLVMGRTTFDLVNGMDDWIYGNLPVKVISHRAPPATLIQNANIEFLNGDPEELLDVFDVAGVKHIYIDGGSIVRQFLELDLIDEIILTQVPALLGNGIRLFTSTLNSDKWKLANQQLFPNGFVQNTFVNLSRM